ncbi:MAG: phenylalanine--tRNA ligase subunit beta [Thermodesulfobacteriota bacterium]
MKASFNWLREFVEINAAPSEVADTLTMAGLEVETVEEIGTEFRGVTVAQIVSIEKHPNADRLSLCHVKTDSARRKIVCGAANIAVGDRVPLALPGAQLPGGMEITRATIRGVESEGMICSEVELGLGENAEGIMILDSDAPLGMDITDYLGLKDYIFDIGVTPNRSDCLGIIGIAREVAAVTGKPLRKGRIHLKGGKGKGIEKRISIGVDIPSFCRRYRARMIEGVTIGPSPLWLEKRLALHGVRAVNNIVDVTNYVMLEYSQPLHAFDHELIEGRRIVVRNAKAGESIETIDGSNVPLGKGIPVIADGAGPVALAGIMGGKRTEIGETTRNILLECAFFEPTVVRRASRSVGISSESSYRFERGVDIEAIGVAIDRAAKMILEMGGGTLVEGAIDIYPEKYKPARIPLSRERVNALLGTDLTMSAIKGALKRLGIATRSGRKKGTFIAEPPANRLDIVREADLIEEVARLTSYDNIPSTMPKGAIAPVRRERHREVKSTAREILTNLGLFEVINYSFIGEDASRLAGSGEEDSLRLLNPLSEEQTLLRKNLFPSLLKNLRYNLNRENRDVKIFEIGKAFTCKENQSREREYVGALLFGERYGMNWSQPKGLVDFYDIKGVLESLMEGLHIDGVRFGMSEDTSFLHPGKSAALFLGEDGAGFVGAVHPTILESLDIEGETYVFELSLDVVVSHSKPFMRHGSVPRYPAVKRDISFVVDRDIAYEAIASYIMGIDEIIIEDVELFDVYCGKNIPAGKVSMAIRVTYRSGEGTLTDGEVTLLHDRIVNGLNDRFKLEIRGVEATPTTV